MLMCVSWFPIALTVFTCELLPSHNVHEWKLVPLSKVWEKDILRAEWTLCGISVSLGCIGPWIASLAVPNFVPSLWILVDLGDVGLSEIMTNNNNFRF